MKKLFLNAFSFTFVLTLLFSLFTSCSSSDENTNNFDKRNSMEFGNALFLPQEDGSILKYVNNKKAYSIDMNTQINVSKIMNNRNVNETYRISNPNTNEFIDIIDVQEGEGYFTFNAVTSTGEQLNNIKYYGDNFLVNLENQTDSGSINSKVYQNEIQCGPCVAVIVSAVVTIIDSLQDTPLEQCRSAMQALNCSGGRRPYMQFSEGWFSTTCNVGCR